MRARHGMKRPTGAAEPCEGAASHSHAQRTLSVCTVVAPKALSQLQSPRRGDTSQVIATRSTLVRIVLPLLLLVLGCKNEAAYDVTDPGSGALPTQALMELSVGGRYLSAGSTSTGVASGARFETPWRKGGHDVHRLVLDDDVFLFEQTDGGVVWWGQMSNEGWYDRPVMLIPSDLRSGMTWETQDGSGGVTHLGSAYGLEPGWTPFGESLRSWTVTLEEVKGRYAVEQLQRSYVFHFVEGAGITGVATASNDRISADYPARNQIGSYRAGFDHMVVVRGADSPALDGPALRLESTGVSVPGRVRHISGKTEGNELRLELSTEHFELEQELAGGVSWYVAKRYEDRPCVSIVDGNAATGCIVRDVSPRYSELVENVPNLPVLGTQWTLPPWAPEGTLSAEGIQTNQWIGALTLGTYTDRAATHAVADATEDADPVDVAMRSGHLVWGHGAIENGSPAWPFEADFIKAGMPHIHQHADGGEALITDADGPVWRVRFGQQGLEKELLGIVDLPEGHWLTGAVRDASPREDADGTTLYVTTTTGRMEPLVGPEAIIDPSVSTLWRVQLGDTTVLPADAGDVTFLATDTGPMACALGEDSPVSSTFKGFDSPSETRMAYGASCSVNPGAYLSAEGTAATLMPFQGTATLTSGAEVEYLWTTSTGSGRHRVDGPVAADYFTQEGGAGLWLTFDQHGIPIGPGPGVDHDLQQISVNALQIDAYDGSALPLSELDLTDPYPWSAGGGGVYEQKVVEGVLRISWTDGASTWSKDLEDTPSRDLAVWADGRYCVLGTAVALCEGSDGTLRSSPLEGAAAPLVAMIVAPDHALRITEDGIVAIDSETAVSLRVSDLTPVSGAQIHQASDGAVWSKAEDNVIFRVDAEGTTTFALPEPEEGNHFKPIAFFFPLGATHLFAILAEENPIDGVVRIYRRFPRVEYDYVLPDPVVLPPGTRVGDVTVGDINSPGTDTLPVGVTPDLAAVAALTIDETPMVYSGAGWSLLRPAGPQALSFDGTLGAQQAWPGLTPLVPLDDKQPPTSADGRYVLLESAAGTADAKVVRVDLHTLTATNFEMGAEGSSIHPFGHVAMDGTAVFLDSIAADFTSFGMGAVDATNTLHTAWDMPYALRAAGTQFLGGRLAASPVANGSAVHMVDPTTGEWVADLHTAGVVYELAADPTGHYLLVLGRFVIELWSTGAGSAPDAFTHIGTVDASGHEVSWSPLGDRFVVVDRGSLAFFEIGLLGPVSVGVVDTNAVLATFGIANERYDGRVIWAEDGSGLTLLVATETSRHALRFE